MCRGSGANWRAPRQFSLSVLSLAKAGSSAADRLAFTIRIVCSTLLVIPLGFALSCVFADTAAASDAERDDTLGIEDASTDLLLPPALKALPETTPDVTVLIAAQRTALPRTTDTLRTARKEGQRSVARLVRLRDREDANFAYRAVNLAKRMKETSRFINPPELATAATGDEFLQALIVASRQGPISNLVVFGHAAPKALYMREDQGFYASVAEVAEKSPLAIGIDAQGADVLRTLGARDLGDLEKLIGSGDVRFAADAVIVLTGCASAGHRRIDMSGIAARLADITGATIIASVGVTDQSMMRRAASRWNLGGSRGSWMRFAKGTSPQKLPSKYVDALQQLHTDGVPSAVTTGPG
jgi:hypothetical protein